MFMKYILNLLEGFILDSSLSLFLSDLRLLVLEIELNESAATRSDVSLLNDDL